MDNYTIAWERFRLSNKLTVDQMNELLSISQGARDAVTKQANKQENNGRHH